MVHCFVFVYSCGSEDGQPKQASLVSSIATQYVSAVDPG
jgi:hypothetical protein